MRWQVDRNRQSLLASHKPDLLEAAWGLTRWSIHCTFSSRKCDLAKWSLDGDEKYSSIISFDVNRWSIWGGKSSTQWCAKEDFDEASDGDDGECLNEEGQRREMTASFHWRVTLDRVKWKCFLFKMSYVLKWRIRLSTLIATETMNCWLRLILPWIWWEWTPSTVGQVNWAAYCDGAMVVKQKIQGKQVTSSSFFTIHLLYSPTFAMFTLSQAHTLHLLHRIAGR